MPIDRFGEDEKRSSSASHINSRLQKRVDDLERELDSHKKEQLVAAATAAEVVAKASEKAQRAEAVAAEAMAELAQWKSRCDALMRQQMDAAAADDAAAAARQTSNDLVATSIKEAKQWKEHYEAEVERSSAALNECDDWQAKFAALERELPARAEKMATAKARQLEADLDKAHSCIATLRASRWQEAATKRQARLQRLEAEEEEEEAAGSAAEAQMFKFRLEAEAGVLARELMDTESALQQSSAAAVALGQKAEQLLSRLTEKTAMAAQRASADLIGAHVRGGYVPPAQASAPMPAIPKPAPAPRAPLASLPQAGAGRGMLARPKSVPQLVPKDAVTKQVCVAGRR